MDHRLTPPAIFRGGAIDVPGDKSISHRVAMLAGMAKGISEVSGFLASDDCLNTLRAVESLGARVERDGCDVRITGAGGQFIPVSGDLDLGNSGTGTRLLAGLLAGHDFKSRLTGDESLCSRPMTRIKIPLELMGASVILSGEKGCAPVTIKGGDLHSIEYALPVASAQVKSCVMLAGLMAEGRTVVIEPKPTRDHTEKLLSAMGLPVTVEGGRISVDGSSGRPLECDGISGRIPGDFSSAAFWITAASFTEGADLVVREIGLNARRTALLTVLKRMGADISLTQTEDSDSWEPVGTVTVKGASLKGTTVGGNEIPNLIDELPLVAVAGVFAEGETVITDAAELRVKESDRIAAIVSVLSAFGVEVEEEREGLTVLGQRGRRFGGGIVVDSMGDHRIAMAAALLALSSSEPVEILRTACITTSYPSFWKDLDSLCRTS